MTVDTGSSLESFVAKLERRKTLPADARAEMLALPAVVRQFAAQDLVAEQGADSHFSYFLASGFLSRQKLDASRTPQIMAFAIPGDAVDLQSLWFHKQDHSLVAHKRSAVLAVEHTKLINLCDRFPLLAKALWHDSLVDAAIFREWTLNVGHRRASHRIAHLFLELASRLEAHGLIQGDVFELPLTQSDLASALGLSLVHLNKSLKKLRDEALVGLEGRVVSVLDRPALVRMTGFDPTYLHLSTKPRF